ncbi:hypothetical protein B0A49_00054 [Cryomyces minteri]|uniref:Uncharacterized protein n=1 Tax=Cryomyces minteri TaxID=331657 RepID=A0A4U0XX13_9PEZI|nr:hypothetical protein B0A49_00054 [Cryomyces minteri]
MPSRQLLSRTTAPANPATEHASLTSAARRPTSRTTTRNAVETQPDPYTATTAPTSFASSRPNPASFPNPRRNLFAHTLSRRPTTSSIAASTIQVATEESEETTLAEEEEEGEEECEGMVYRDESGSVLLPMPEVPQADLERELGEENEREQEQSHLTDLARDFLTGGNKFATDEEGKSLPLYNRRYPNRPRVELRAALWTSLREKTAALEEERWMYEAEDSMAALLR